MFAYFMFFYNIFIGIVGCLMRMIKAVIIGTLFLGRLDHSTLPRRFQLFDPGRNICVCKLLKNNCTHIAYHMLHEVKQSGFEFVNIKTQSFKYLTKPRIYH